MPKPKDNADATPEPDNNEPSLSDQLLEGQDLDALNADDDLSTDDDISQATDVPGDGGQPAHATGGEPPELDDDLEGGDHTSLVQRISELGFADVESDDEALERLIEAYQLTSAERAQYEQQVRQLEPLANYGTQYIVQQQQQIPRADQQPEGAPKEPEKWWNPPHFDHLEAERYREFDPDTGGQRWKAETPAEVKISAQQYQAYLEKWSQDLVHRPAEVLPKIIEQEFDRLFEDRYGSRMRQQTEESFYDTKERENAHWLYRIDPVTKRIQQDREGYPVVTPAGELMLGQMERLRQKGLTDPEDVWEFALNSVRAHYAQNQQGRQQASASAQETARRKREEHARRGSALPDRSGSFNSPEVPGDVPQNRKLSIGDRLLQEAEASGEVIWSS
jgi:hypothetical protein